MYLVMKMRIATSVSKVMYLYLNIWINTRLLTLGITPYTMSMKPNQSHEILDAGQSTIETPFKSANVPNNPLACPLVQSDKCR